MSRFLHRITQFLDVELTPLAHVLLLLAALTIVPSYGLPLWRISMYSNQFPNGLRLDIYSWRLEGGGLNGTDLNEINSLNHYIGMRALDANDFTEFRWIPFVLGAFALFALRAMVFGKIGGAVDLFAMFSYFGLFSLWSFYHKMYLYGHTLDPTAAIKVAPFMPPVFGKVQLANFTVYSFPQSGSVCLAIVPLLVAIAILISWRAMRRRAAER